MAKLKQMIRNDIPHEFNEMKILMEHRKRLELILQGEVLPPYEVLIHPTATCNLSCKWCIGQNVDNEETTNVKNALTVPENLMNLAKSLVSYKKEYIIDGKKEKFGVEKVSFSGITGEPMMASKALIPTIEYLATNDIKVGMFSNGLLINKNNMETILKMNYILVSLDAGNGSTYDFLKTEDKKTKNFETILNNLKMLIDNREKYNSNLDVNIGFIVNAYNYKEMYDLAGILKSIGVHNFRIKTDIASRLNVDDEMIKEIKRDFERIRQDFEDGYFKLVTIHKLEENDKIRTFNKCTINKLVSNVSSDGNVYACNYHPPIDGVRYDNVLKYDFETIWENANKDFDIKELCPKMCDPFKTRANNLLDAITESNDISTGINEALEIYEFEKK
ncbi:radical SAM/SPASM domain-containing protein [Bacillus toyonensis]|uniref:radical SAM/SPASM domain-containing protein n=1 Tax=Bacillus toyonensis TaxID=155322 RepID=UPI0002E28D0E|nr:radical SAM protein [Bacillus toyonensis]